MIRKFMLTILAVGLAQVGSAQVDYAPKPDMAIALPYPPTAAGMQWTGGVRSQGTSGDGSLTVSNISEPTLLAYLPDPAQATGTALIIAPGGGFHFLAIENEGTDLAVWARDRGIAAFVLQYRLVPTGENPQREFEAKFQASQEQMDRSIAPYVELAKADGRGAIAYLRQNASEYGIDPDRIGIIGFSAGGTVAAAAGLEYGSITERPNFIAPIYAALHLLDLDSIPEEPMPLFIAVSSRDIFGFQRQSIELFQTWNAAEVPAELHIYQDGNHGFGMRKTGNPGDAWIDAFYAWLGANGF